MTNLLVIKEHLRNIYGKYEIYIFPVVKFILAFISLMLVNGKLGYMDKINNVAIVLMIAIMCSFLPINFIIIAAAAFIVLHVYALSIECAIIIFAVILVMFLLYFRFSPKETIAVLLTPVCFLLKIPYVVPLTMGLVGTPASALSVGCGIVVYEMMEYVSFNATSFGAADTENAIIKLRMVVDGLLNNKAMNVTLVAFTITIIVVYVIRRMEIDYAWTVAIIVGIVVNVVAMFAGDLIFDINLSLMGAILGGLVSALIAKVIQFFTFNVDYTRTEKVQFEDDEYYYYVKAVPKIMVATPEKSVKKINIQRKTAGVAKPIQKSVTKTTGNTIDRAIDRSVAKAADERNKG